MSKHAKTLKARYSHKLIRASLVLITLIGAYFSVTGSMARVVERVDPSRAFAFAEYNGKIAASYANQQFTIAPSADNTSVPIRLATLAMAKDPTAIDAVVVLGQQAMLKNDTERARAYFNYAQVLSRRNLNSHLWAIEEAVTRGDIQEALRHYDMALRTSPRASELLLPNLVASIGEPKIRTGLLKLLSKRPSWEPKFLAAAAADTRDPDAVMVLFDEGVDNGLPISTDMRNKLVSAAVRNGDYFKAWSYYAKSRRGVDRRRSRDPKFTFETYARAPFDWVPSRDSRFSTAILSEQKGGVFDFFVPPGNSGLLLKQLQLLPQGIYRLTGGTKGIEQPQRSLPYWTLRCVHGQELGRVNVPSSHIDNGRFEGTFIVPKGCPVQTLSLMARSSDQIGGISGQIVYTELSQKR